MAKLVTSCILLAPASRAKAIENLEGIESAYRTVAWQGDSDMPGVVEDEVDLHYVSFVKSSKSECLYELDGDRKGPVDHGALASGVKIVTGSGLDITQKLVRREEDANANLSLLVLMLS